MTDRRSCRRCQGYGQASKYSTSLMPNAPKGLSPLAMDRGLLEAAMQRAVESLYFSHEAPRWH